MIRSPASSSWSRRELVSAFRRSAAEFMISCRSSSRLSVELSSPVISMIRRSAWTSSCPLVGMVVSPF
jgi:hypothetical protein